MNIVIDVSDFNKLVQAAHLLKCLRRAGVENWEWYPDACKEAEEQQAISDVTYGMNDFAMLFDDVGRFHVKMGLPVSGKFLGVEQDSENVRTSRLLNEQEFEYRLKFMEEELQEYRDAQHYGDLVSAADALVDLVWVALGTAHYHGFPFNELWQEVRRANMDKVAMTMPGDHKRGGMERVRKPPGWRGPNLVPLLLPPTLQAAAPVVTSDDGTSKHTSLSDDMPPHMGEAD